MLGYTTYMSAIRAQYVFIHVDFSLFDAQAIGLFE